MRVMLTLCGLVVKVKDEVNRRDTCSVVVCNYISPVDRLMFSLIQPNIMVSLLRVVVSSCFESRQVGTQMLYLLLLNN